VSVPVAVSRDLAGTWLRSGKLNTGLGEEGLWRNAPEFLQRRGRAVREERAGRSQVRTGKH